MGTVHAGEPAVIRVRATDPVGGGHIRDAAAEAWLYAPGRDPEHDASDRLVPDRSVLLEWDEAARCYHGLVPTEGMRPGIWTVMGRVSGGTHQHHGLSFTPLEVRP